MLNILLKVVLQMYSKMPTKPKICIFFRFGLPTTLRNSPFLPKQVSFFLAHLSRMLKVRYCDRFSSGVHPAIVFQSSVNFFFKQHLLLNHWSKFHITPHECSNALFQSCINGSSPLNRRAARAPDKKSFKQHLLNHWPKF